MKKTIISLCVAGMIALLPGCKTAQGVTSTGADINGEWKITEVNGKTIKTAQGENEAYLGFDMNEKKVSGCAGCNRVFGNLDIDTDKQAISFASLASTQMLCANMATENLVKSALAEVTTYQTGKGGTLMLKSADGKTYIKLVKKAGK